MEELYLKIPEATPSLQDFLLQGPVKCLNPFVFDEINHETIKMASIKAKGASGLSALDAKVNQKQYIWECRYRLQKIYCSDNKYHVLKGSE